ncbi:MAG: aminoglycoside phosphotransferase [Acidimicrobiia bacterium]|nr:MAG: aminoglycoside phosphotransferase [Acidimicrobiia bacterium]
MKAAAADAVRESLASWFARRLGVGQVEVTDLRRHAEGFSWQTYTLTVTWQEAGGWRSAGYAVRRQPEDGLLPPYDIETQYRLHEALLAHSRIPLPRLYWLETDPAVLGMPFYVMERMEGVVPVQWRGNDPDIFPDEARRRAIGEDFVSTLALIHQVDPVAAGLHFLPGETDTDASARAQIDHWESFYEESRLMEVPLLRFLIGFLRRHLATSGRGGLVHGDYRIGNFMLGPDGKINAVFDWELAHIGDVVFDLAWAAMPLFRGRSPLVSQLLPRDEFLRRYRELTGLEVHEEVFRFWTLFGHLRAAAPHLRGSRAFEDGRTNDLRLAAMGHQSLYILRQLVTELGWRG